MSEKPKEGGPAFPFLCSFPDENDAFYKAGTPGMTLRQYYKAAAMTFAGHLAISMAENGTVSKDSPGQVAHFAAELADAMLAEDEAHAKQSQPPTP